MAIATILELTDGTKYLKFKCPACGCHELIPFRAGSDYKGPVWKFNGNLESPTLQPSVRHYVPDDKGKIKETTCHYFLTSGNISYCNDSPHELSGQTVRIPELIEIEE